MTTKEFDVSLSFDRENYECNCSLHCFILPNKFIFMFYNVYEKCPDKYKFAFIQLTLEKINNIVTGIEHDETFTSEVRDIDFSKERDIEFYFLVNSNGKDLIKKYDFELKKFTDDIDINTFSEYVNVPLNDWHLD